MTYSVRQNVSRQTVTLGSRFSAECDKIGGNLIKQNKTKGKAMNKKSLKDQITKRNIIAVMGVILIQGALLPSHLSGHFPALSLPVLIFLGLLCYMYKALLDNDYVYIFSNTVGLTLNGLMIIRILIGG